MDEREPNSRPDALGFFAAIVRLLALDDRGPMGRVVASQVGTLGFFLLLQFAIDVFAWFVTFRWAFSYWAILLAAAIAAIVAGLDRLIITSKIQSRSIWQRSAFFARGLVAFALAGAVAVPMELAFMADDINAFMDYEGARVKAMVKDRMVSECRDGVGREREAWEEGAKPSLRLEGQRAMAPAHAEADEIEAAAKPASSALSQPSPSGTLGESDESTGWGSDKSFVGVYQAANSDFTDLKRQCTRFSKELETTAFSANNPQNGIALVERIRPPSYKWRPSQSNEQNVRWQRSHNDRVGKCNKARNKLRDSLNTVLSKKNDAEELSTIKLREEAAKIQKQAEVKLAVDISLTTHQEELKHQNQQRATEKTREFEKALAVCAFEVPAHIQERGLKLTDDTGQDTVSYGRLSDASWSRLAEGLPVGPVVSFGARWAALNCLSSRECLTAQTTHPSSEPSVLGEWHEQAERKAPLLRLVRLGLCWGIFAVLSLSVLAGKLMLHPDAKDYYQYGYDPSLKRED